MKSVIRSGLAACAVLVVLSGCIVQPAPTPVVYAPRPAPVYAPPPVVVRPPPVVVVQPAPPPIIIERPGPPPGPYYVFRRGHWVWNGYRWIWVPGHYVAY